MNPHAPRLGPFALEHPAGKGGMAEVWRARHVDRGTPVAIKVITAITEDDDEPRRRFVEEVRAVARLDHAGIIRVHDYGAVPADASRLTGGLLPPGAPYLVMDWEGGGTLRALRGRLRFAELRSMVLALLDALAHAHARGVIHRDLKPANVLIGEHGPVLSDFGVVFSLSEHRRPEELVAGTPNYMAPEQVTNDWRAFGPWTDLYALGCLTWALATGRAPYAGRGAMKAMMGHVTGALPVLFPKHPVPDGFEAWLHRMLVRDPRSRFRFAADAAVALMALPEIDSSLDLPLDDETTVLDDDRTIVSPPRFTAITETAWMQGPRPDRRPPMPTDWRRPDPPGAPPLPGCGRALVELREPRMRGRELVRALMWQRLGAVVGDAGCQVVVLDGPAGIGKSRLAQWISRRAHELGQADHLMMSHAPTFGPGHGVGPMLARALRVDGLAPSAVAERLERLQGVERGRAVAIAAAIDPGRTASLGAVRITLRGEHERLVAQADALALAASVRPLVVHVDDAQWGEHALRLITYLLDKHPELPALFVITVRSADLRSDRLAPALLTALEQHEAVDRLAIGPLSAQAHQALSRARLSLEPSTLSRLTGATRGNPLFAIELLRHWLHEDALEETTEGARLRADRPVDVPPDLTVLWRVRVDALLADLRPDPMPALELAAVGGIEVDEAEWADALAEAGMARPDAAVERLLDVGLITPTSQGCWAFSHGMLRDALEQRAADTGRQLRWHIAWARGLNRRAQALGATPNPERIAQHLSAAGDDEAALPLWLEAARDTSLFSDMATADRAVLAGARAARRLRLNRRDPRWIRLKIIWAEYLFASSRSGAPRHGRHAVEAAQAIDDVPLITRAYMALGTVMSARSRADAVPLLEAACDAAARCGERHRESQARRRLGLILLGLGRYLEAEARLAEAEVIDRELDDEHGLALTQRHQSELALAQGDLSRADRMARASHARYVTQGNRFGQAASITVVGEVARRRGQLDAAERAYNEAWRVLEGIDHIDAAVLAINLSQISLARGDFTAAERRARWVRQRSIDAGHAVYRACAESVLLCCAAREGDAAAWDLAWEGLGPAHTLRFTEMDVAAGLVKAAELSAGALPERAAAARALARRQYEAMGREDEARAIG